MSCLKSNSYFENSIKPSPAKVRFQLPFLKNVKEVLENYVNRTNSKPYWDLIRCIKENDLSDDELISLLDELSKCISLLIEDVRYFVEQILSIKWNHRTKETVRSFQNFIFNLLSAHNYYVNFTVNKLISNFVSDNDVLKWKNGIPCEDEYQKYVNIHYVINILFKVIPMSTDIILKNLEIYYPYFKKDTHCHEVYVNNLLWILDYKPEFRIQILSLIFQKLVILDVNAPRKAILDAEDEIENNDEDDDNMDTSLLEIFPMDQNETEKVKQETQHSVAHTLDICLERIFVYIKAECFKSDTGELNWGHTKQLYIDMLKIFENLIMPTFELDHVQYTLFYLCSFKLTLAEAFLNFLWKKSVNPSLAIVHRQVAISYLASFLARAAYIPLDILKNYIEQITTWIHLYINTQDGLENINIDMRVHLVFFNMCQALFYIIAFRHRDLIQSKKNLVFLQNLNLSKIVTCRLNPLRFCIQPVVQNFAAITRTYQLVYCYTIMENNARNKHPIVYKDTNGQLITMDITTHAFFPFDPYLLKHSKHNIQPYYVEYQALSSDNINDNQLKEYGEEDDDFLVENSFFKSSPTKQIDFSYSTSPGFKH